MTTTASGRRSRMTPLARREARWGYIFLSPWLAGFAAFTLLPMIATLAFTFTNLTLSQEEPLQFVGIENYQRLFSDAQTWRSLAVTLRFSALWLPTVIIAPFLVALLLNARSLRGAKIFRVLFFLPYVVPFVAGVFLWQGMLANDGWVNALLEAIGLPGPSWLFDTGWIYPALVMIGIWGIGAGIVINLAGLQGIPAELYDAAQIDGAGYWGQLRHVTIPFMTPIFLYSIVLGVVEVMQYFLVPLVLKSGTGEHGGATLFYNLHLYKNFFTFQNMAYGATLAWFLFVLILGATLLIFWSSRRWVYYAGER
jgi:ABC-type sugar transport system permease subunit